MLKSIKLFQDFIVANSDKSYFLLKYIIIIFKNARFSRVDAFAAKIAMQSTHVNDFGYRQLQLSTLHCVHSSWEANVLA